MKRRTASSCLAAAVATFWLALSVPVFGQEPILSFSVRPDPVTIAAGGRAEIRILLQNDSVYEADDIEIAWTETNEVSLVGQIDPIEVIPPFQTGDFQLSVSAAADGAEGEQTTRFELIYTYCIGEVCYQIAEEGSVGVAIEAAGPSVGETDGAPVEVTQPVESAPSIPWEWIGLAAAGLLAGIGLALSRKAGRAGSIAALLIVLVAGGLAYGVFRNQHEQAQGIGAVLCTSCVGIEEARHADEARLSPSAIEALRTLDTDVELTVFYAKWCHSCPYAEALVAHMAAATDRIEFVLVDVDEEPGLAETHGVVRSDRTIVPAIVRAGSDRVLFGIENLESRLLDLLGVGE